MRCRNDRSARALADHPEAKHKQPRTRKRAEEAASSSVLDIPPDLEASGFSKLQMRDICSDLAVDSGVILVIGPSKQGQMVTVEAIIAEYLKRELKVIEVDPPIEFPRQFGDDKDRVSLVDSVYRICLNSYPGLLCVGQCDHSISTRFILRLAVWWKIAIRCPVADSGFRIGMGFKGIREAMGIALSKQAYSLNVIISPRLIRLLCSGCKVIDEGASRVRGAPIYRHVGCAQCDATGYKGSAMLAEVLLIRPEIRRWIARYMKGQEIVERAIARGWMQSLEEAAEEKLRAGMTSVFEVERVLNGDDKDAPDLRAAQALFYRKQAESIEAQKTLVATNVQEFENLPTLLKDLNGLSRKLSLMMVRANRGNERD